MQVQSYANLLDFIFIYLIISLFIYLFIYIFINAYYKGFAWGQNFKSKVAFWMKTNLYPIHTN